MTENVSSANHTPIFPEEFGVSKTRKRKARAFKDAPYWDNLATKYLNSYQLPNWGVPPDVEAIELWMQRVRVSKAEFSDTLGTSPADFIKLNKRWPLRAVIGLLLEVRETRSSTKPAIG